MFGPSISDALLAIWMTRTLYRSISIVQMLTSMKFSTYEVNMVSVITTDNSMYSVSVEEKVTVIFPLFFKKWGSC
jgi:hypothetical protein